MFVSKAIITFERYQHYRYGCGCTGTYSKECRVLCLLSILIVNGMYHVRIDEHTPPALCLNTIVPKQKEALTITWTCDKFADYLTGLHFHVELITSL